MFAYFIERSSSYNGEDTTINIDGQAWKLSRGGWSVFDDITFHFTCVSYAWGQGRMPSPFSEAQAVSDRTISALTAVIRCRPAADRFWIDAFCVPSNETAKRATLARMGFIYSRAAEVVSVLSAEARPVLMQMMTSDRIDEHAIAQLEQEDWINRAWTYQEVVNGRRLYFTCFTTSIESEGNELVVDGLHFLNCVGFALSKMTGTALEKIQRYPRLDAFGELILDWMVAEFQERSALQVMSNMHRRTQERAEDHFYAMVGAIMADVPPSIPDNTVKNACEYFMAVCEAKGDFSFIFSNAKRSYADGRNWRPESGNYLPPILSWHSWGGPQTGQVMEDGKLLLEKVVLPEILPLSTHASAFIENWAHEAEISSIADFLRHIGFEGPGDCIETEAGYFFPLKYHPFSEKISIIVSSSLRWSFGGPGLICIRTDQQTLVEPGVFVGRVNPEMATSTEIF